MIPEKGSFASRLHDQDVLHTIKFNLSIPRNCLIILQ